MPVIIPDTWTEDIDGATYVAHARCGDTWRGQIFGASAFMLLPREVPRHHGREAVRKHLLGLMASFHFLPDGGVHRFGMPVVGTVRDLRR